MKITQKMKIIQKRNSSDFREREKKKYIKSPKYKTIPDNIKSQFVKAIYR